MLRLYLIPGYLKMSTLYIPFNIYCPQGMNTSLLVTSCQTTAENNVGLGGGSQSPEAAKHREGEKVCPFQRVGEHVDESSQSPSWRLNSSHTSGWRGIQRAGVINQQVFLLTTYLCKCWLLLIAQMFQPHRGNVADLANT